MDTLLQKLDCLSADFHRAAGETVDDPGQSMYRAGLADAFRIAAFMLRYELEQGSGEKQAPQESE